MSETEHNDLRHRRARLITAWLIMVLMLGACAATGLYFLRQRQALHVRLLQLRPDEAGADLALIEFASSQAKPLYARYCAVCHGQDMRGNALIGAPNLIDRIWLYGDGSVHEIERTLLYGIRSGNGKDHNVTDMPAFGSGGRLSSAEVSDEVQYVMQLSGRTYLAQAANEGKALYVGKANCADCHGDDGRGNTDYGAPDLTANVWNSGGDSQSLYRSIYYGQHRLMPAWIGILSLEQIRALAIYIHAAADPHSNSVTAY